MRDIVFKLCVYAPPERRFCVWHDGEDHCGYGATEQEALADLDRLDQEQAEEV